MNVSRLCASEPQFGSSHVPLRRRVRDRLGTRTRRGRVRRHLERRLWLDVVTVKILLLDAEDVVGRGSANRHVVVGDACRWLFPDDEFDLIFSNF